MTYIYQKPWLFFELFFSPSKYLISAFGFRLRGGKGATFFGHPESRFVQHQWLPPCRWSLTLTRSKSYMCSAPAGKSVPRLPWPPRLGWWACLQTRLVMTLPKQPATGRVWGLQWNWLFRIVRPKLRKCHLPLPLSSKPSKNHHETETSRKTLSTVEISLLMKSSTLPNRCSIDLQLENSVEPQQRSWGLPNLWAAMSMTTTFMTS